MSGNGPATPPLGLSGVLARAFIASPLTPLLLVAALAAGLLALLVLPREEEPQISVPMVDIMVRADGLKAEDATRLVTEPLEAVVKGISGVEHVYSQTRDDRVMVTARFFVGTSPDAAILRVHEKIRANLDRIPVGIPEPMIVGRGIDDVAIVVVTLTAASGAADRYDEAALHRLGEDLRVELAKLPDVGLTYLVGGRPEQIRIEPDPERLARTGLTLQQVVAKLEGANRSFLAGSLRREGRQLELAAGQTLVSLQEIGNLLLTTRDGRPVYLRDVATVTLAPAPVESRVMRGIRAGEGFERRPAVSVAVAKRAGANAVVIAGEVVRQIEALKGSVIPAGVEAAITRNYGETASDKADELLFHLGLATLSIVALVVVAIGWRAGVVVAIVIPTTILLTLFAALAMGYTINRVSLFALIFAIGILVDDAIVVIENIARHWAMHDGRSRLAAAVDAVAEVGNPTIVATLTVVAALLPMLFVSGLMGPYMSPIPAVASAAMIFSFFVAVMVTPWLMLRIAGRAGAGHEEAADGGVIGRIYRALARPVIASRAGAWIFLIVVGIATLGSLGLFYTKSVTVKLLPFDNKPELSVVIDLPEGATLEDTDRVLAAALARLAPIPEIVAAQTHAGTAAPFDFNGLVRHSFLRASPELGDIQIELTNRHDRKRTSHDIALEIRERLKGLDMPAATAVKVVEPPPGPPVLATLLAEVYGPDAQTRRAVATELRNIFASIPFVVDVDDSFGERAPRIRLVLDQDNLEFYKVEQRDVYDTIRALYGSIPVGYSHRGGGRHPIPIAVTLPKGGRVIDERMLSVPVPANLLPGERGIVELGDVVRLVEEKASHPVYRRNGHPAEMVTAELAGAFEAPIYGMLAVQEAIDRHDWKGLPKPVVRLAGQPLDQSKPTLLWDGEWEVTWVTFRDMGAAFMVAILAIYALVVAQFGSFRLPLVILIPIPLTLLGIMLGHWIMGAAFTATSMIGFIALAGIIVRNSILLADFIRHAQAPGRPLRDVLLEAGSVRAKPILLTALAAMIGAAVILADPIFQGLAVSLLFGLASSTLLTVLVMPAVYVALRDDGRPASA
jgi:multidrug efflux pump subunit AcrB